jgi:hypothetical protein
MISAALRRLAFGAVKRCVCVCECLMFVLELQIASDPVHIFAASSFTILLKFLPEKCSHKNGLFDCNM